MKAKAKKKKFVVAWADYLTNERKNQLGCGVLGKSYSTRKAAYNAIMRELRCYVYAHINATINATGSPSDPITDEQVNQVVRDGMWYKDAWCVKFTLDDVENVLVIKGVEV